MKDKSSTVLIVGSDSLVGRALMTYLQQMGEHVIGTTRQRESIGEFHIYLDLRENMDKWQCPWPINVAIICAGVTKLKACKQDPIGSALVNVEGISILIKNLVARNSFVIYLSTNQVFDGSVPLRLPSDSVCPVTEYGRQKAETEKRISECGNNISIVRFARILQPNFPLFSSWVESLKNNKSIHPFLDMTLAPVSLHFSIQVLYKISKIRLPGIVQVSANKDITYAEAARYIANIIGANPDLVQPINSDAAGLQFEAIPRYTSLDTSRLREKLGIDVPDIWSTINSVLYL